MDGLLAFNQEVASSRLARSTTISVVQWTECLTTDQRMRVRLLPGILIPTLSIINDTNDGKNDKTIH